ncbi:unnamed protein product [Diplocarpon coronariae]
MNVKSADFILPQNPYTFRFQIRKSCAANSHNLDDPPRSANRLAGISHLQVVADKPYRNLLGSIVKHTDFALLKKPPLEMRPERFCAGQNYRSSLTQVVRIILVFRSFSTAKEFCDWLGAEIA